METTKNNNQIRQSKIDKIFTLVKGQDEKIRIAIGNYLLSQKTFDTYSQADVYLGTKPYEIIINLAYIAIKTKEENEKEQTQSNENTKRN